MKTLFKTIYKRINRLQFVLYFLNMVVKIEFIFFILLQLIFVKPVHAQSKIFKGYIKDLATGEAVPFATVYEMNNKKGIISDIDGFFEFKLKKTDTLRVEISHLSYFKLSVNLPFPTDTSIFFLTQNIISLKEVVVTASNNSKFGNSSFTVLNNKQINNISALGGEKDVLKAFQTTPGVQAGLEGSVGLIVRGGGSDQNLYLIDNMPLYSPSHLFGFLSTFNSDIIYSAELIRAGMPANYGGKLSSLIDIKTKKPSYIHAKGSIYLGLISSKIYAEVPVLKSKSGLLFSFRRSYFDVLTYFKAKYDIANERNKTTFNDINIKYEHNINLKNVLSVNYLRSSDKFYYLFNNTENLTKSEDVSGVNWLNSALFMNYKYLHNSNNTLLIFAGVSNYEYNYINESYSMGNIENSYRRNTSIKDISIKAEYENINILYNKLVGGIAYTHHIISPLNIYILNNTILQSQESADELAVFLQSNINLGDFDLLSVGIRQSFYFKNNTSFFPIEPRINYIKKIGSLWELKTSISRNIQFIHRIENYSTGLPTETWHVSDAQLKYEDSYQISTELVRIFQKLKTTFGTAIYLKKMNGLVDYGKYYSDFPLPNIIQSNRIEKNGTGVAYGIEFFINKQQGPLIYSFSYLLSKSIRKFSNINDNKWYPSNFDRLHYLNLNASYILNAKYQFSIGWIFSTGQPVTIPEGRYYLNNSLSAGQAEAYFVGERNNFRLKNYHRLDASVQNKKVKRNGFRIWELSVYNLYNRSNPFSINIEKETKYENGHFIETGKKVKQYSLFPIIPSISYIRNFN